MPRAILAERGRVIWGLSLHGWEEVMRLSLAAAGVFALLVGAATYFVVTLQREEIAASRAEFEQYKIAAGKEVAAVRADADAKIAAANENSAGANARAQEATARAEEARLELAKLKAPRELSREQQARIIAKIRPFVGQQYALSVGAGQEPESLLCLLDSVLQAAGWKRVGPFGDITVGALTCGSVSLNSLSGVHVRAPPEASQQAGGVSHAARTFVDALMAEDISAIGEIDPKNIPIPNAINLMVGVKP